MIIGSAWSADGIEEVGDTDGMGMGWGCRRVVVGSLAPHSFV